MHYSFVMGTANRALEAEKKAKGRKLSKEKPLNEHIATLFVPVRYITKPCARWVQAQKISTCKVF